MLLLHYVFFQIFVHPLLCQWLWIYVGVPPGNSLYTDNDVAAWMDSGSLCVLQIDYISFNYHSSSRKYCHYWLPRHLFYHSFALYIRILPFIAI